MSFAGYPQGLGTRFTCDLIFFSCRSVGLTAARKHAGDRNGRCVVSKCSHRTIRLFSPQLCAGTSSDNQVTAMRGRCTGSRGR